MSICMHGRCLRVTSSSGSFRLTFGPQLDFFNPHVDGLLNEKKCSPSSLPLARLSLAARPSCYNCKSHKSLVSRRISEPSEPPEAINLKAFSVFVYKVLCRGGEWGPQAAASYRHLYIQKDVVVCRDRCACNRRPNTICLTL